MTSVRAAGPEDASAVAELNGIVQGIHYAAHPDRFLPADPDRVEAAFRQWLDNADTRVWLCTADDNEPIGYVVAVHTRRPATPFTEARRFVELDQIAIRDDQRTKGAGRMLALTVADWARTLGVDTLELSVWQFNATAQAFFTGLGFGPLWQRQAWQLPSVPTAF